MTNRRNFVPMVQRSLLVHQPKRRRDALKVSEDGSITRSPAANCNQMLLTREGWVGVSGWLRPWTQALPGLQYFPSAFNEVLAVLDI